MRVTVVVAAFIALCSGNAIPFSGIPGDNSHYVEGQSRFVWMENNEGVPVLVDLEEPLDPELRSGRSGAANSYWLFTRLNPTDGHTLDSSDSSTVTSSNYNASNPLFVISHGWNNDGNSTVNTLIRDAVLSTYDANVIVLDWSSISSLNYVSACNGVVSVGQYLGTFLTWLIELTEGDWDNVHLVGHSLGAHVVGNAGRSVSSVAKRVTGCDPAGPLWYGNSNALSTDGGQYVEAIHTDAGVLGYLGTIAHADFYPNGGTNPQPGCWISTCSHGRSYELFAATVQYDHLVGYLCNNQAEALLNACSGDTLNMGNGDFSKTGSGIYALTTGSESPY